MANVDIRLGHKNTAWFTTNSTLVLKDGQMVVCSDGANQGKYKIGDGVTQLSALTFYGGSGYAFTGLTSQYTRGDGTYATFPTNVSSFTNDSGYITSSALSPYLTIANAALTYQPIGSYLTGLTVGTTGIASGTNTRILYNNNGVVGEYTVTGSGNAVLSISPTLTNTVTINAGTAGSGLYIETDNTGTQFPFVINSLSGANSFMVLQGINNNVIQLKNTTSSVGWRIQTNAINDTFGIGTSSNAALDFIKIATSGQVTLNQTLNTASILTTGVMGINTTAPANYGLYVKNSGIDYGGASFGYNGYMVAGTNLGDYGAFGSNFRFGNGINTYNNTDPALQIYFFGQTFKFRGAASGTAGNTITWTTMGTWNRTAGLYLGADVSATAKLHIAAGSASASTAPIKLTSGTVMSTAEAGAMEYNNTFHLTNSDATRRHIVLAPNTTKVTASAPYVNDGYIVVNIGGIDFKLMTTA
jgi:hypothetical protein